MTACCQTEPSPLPHTHTHTHTHTHSQILTIFTLWCCEVVKLPMWRRTVTSRLRPDAAHSTHLLPVANDKGRVQSGGRLLHSSSPMPFFFSFFFFFRPLVSRVMRPLANGFHAAVGAGCAPPWSLVEHRSRCAIRATETEWHRNRSVATSRGAWLPALICMGGFARRQERHERRSCWMLRERERERGGGRERGRETIGIQGIEL